MNWKLKLRISVKKRMKRILPGKANKEEVVYSGWGSEKVFLDIIFRIHENLLIMISYTIDRLIIVYIKTFLQKIYVFPPVRNWFMVLFSCLINVLFSLILMDFFLLLFFKRSLNFRAHALQVEANKVWCILSLLSSNSKAWALKLWENLKKQQIMFLSSFCQPNLYHDFVCTSL